MPFFGGFESLLQHQISGELLVLPGAVVEQDEETEDGDLIRHRVVGQLYSLHHHPAQSLLAYVLNIKDMYFFPCVT